MTFLAGENIDLPIIQFLRQHNIDIKSIFEDYRSIDDDLVLHIANEEQRILITSDKDFGELVFRLKRVHHGVMLLRLEELLIEEKSKIIFNAIQTRKEELKDAFSVISEHFIRIRK